VANIAAGDVTYTLLQQRKMNGSPSRNLNRVRLAFGDGALTVPAGGIPLTKAKLGCPTDIESLIVVDQGTSGYIFQYDQSAEKLIVMQSALVVTKAAVLASGEVGVSADAATATLNNNTIASTLTLKANSPAQVVEASTMAVAAQTIEVEVVGW
jgi:hypothetical protein